VRAAVRRTGEARPIRLRVGNLTLDTATRAARRGDQTIELTAREYRLLEYLMRMPGRVCARTLLLEHVWGYGSDPGSNLVDVYMAKLRKKIEAGSQPTLLHSLRGVGYMIKETP
jgi:DNA-binding response OmpR family regulator